MQADANLSFKDGGNVNLIVPNRILLAVVAMAATVIFGVWLSNRDLRAAVTDLKVTVDKLEVAVSGINARVPLEIPQPWFRQQVARIDERLADAERSIKRLEIVAARLCEKSDARCEVPIR